MLIRQVASMKFPGLGLATFSLELQHPRAVRKILGEGSGMNWKRVTTATARHLY
jgi:hypothetical protein